MSAAAAASGDAEEQLLAQLQVQHIPQPMRVLAALAHRPPVSAPLPQDVPTEQLMQIRKQVQEEAQYFNESFQQLRMAQS
jgi:hypothetical protein